MEKLKKRLNVVVTIALALSVLLCLNVMVTTIRGEQPQLLGFQFYHVVSGSMEPEIPVNAYVVTKEVETQTLAVGDVITFESHDPLIYGSANTHRIVEILQDETGATYYVTQGDANPSPDELPVYPEQVYGKVVYYTTAIYWISMFFSFVQTGPGFVTVVIFPLMFIGYLFTKDFVKSVNQLLAQEVKEKLEAQALEEEPHEQGSDHTTES